MVRQFLYISDIMVSLRKLYSKHFLLSETVFYCLLQAAFMRVVLSERVCLWISRKSCRCKYVLPALCFADKRIFAGNRWADTDFGSSCSLILRMTLFPLFNIQGHSPAKFSSQHCNFVFFALSVVYVYPCLFIINDFTFYIKPLGKIRHEPVRNGSGCSQTCWKRLHAACLNTT